MGEMQKKRPFFCLSALFAGGYVAKNSCFNGSEPLFSVLLSGNNCFWV